MKVFLYIQYDDEIVDSEKEHEARIEDDFQESMNEWYSDFEEYLSNNYGYKEIFDMDEKGKEAVREEFHQDYIEKYDYNHGWTEIEKEI